MNRRTSMNERPNPLDTTEWWVVKLLLHRGTWKPIKQMELPILEREELAARVERGELVIMPSDGAIGEPVEVFRNQLDANEHMLKLAADNKGQEYRIVMNADVSV
jgi:hypothetical protein